MIERGALLHRGKAKGVYATADPARVIIDFTDDATAFDGKKRGTIGDKGVVNAAISAHCFELLQSRGIPTHFIQRLSDRELLTRRLEIIQIEVVMRNVVAGSLSKRLGLNEGVVLSRPIAELYLKDDALGDPLINQDHALALQLAGEADIERLVTMARAINGLLTEHFSRLNLTLVDFKLEFGRPVDAPDTIILGDEISPDTCRFWDSSTGEKLDKDRFRRDLGGVEEAYREVFRRISGRD